MAVLLKIHQIRNCVCFLEKNNECEIKQKEKTEA